MIGALIYYLSEHPSIVNFRWSHSHSWGSTWSFLFSSISISTSPSPSSYISFSSSSAAVNPSHSALHSLTMSLLSFTIFLGLSFSTVAEIRHTRWFFGRLKTTPFQWLLCFPMGNSSIRPRVFLVLHLLPLPLPAHAPHVLLMGLALGGLIQVLNVAILVKTRVRSHYKFWLKFTTAEIQRKCIVYTTDMWRFLTVSHKPPLQEMCDSLALQLCDNNTTVVRQNTKSVAQLSSCCRTFSATPLQQLYVTNVRRL
ncbi:hypothetical protein QQ045_009056 [Rhodiola kirilowii]